MTTAQKVEFRQLYKRTATGAVQFWNIEVKGSTLVTTYGQIGTDSPQVLRDEIKIGKNIGRANATTADEQAFAEAQSRWIKQQNRKGYVLDLDADDDKPPVPMLAHPFDKHGHKIKYPVLCNPKFDGARCLAQWKNGKITMYTRTGDIYKSVPHLESHIRTLMESNGITEMVLDGELYAHRLHDDFNKIISIVKQKNKIHAEHELIEYHIYDHIDYMAPFKTRLKRLIELIPRNHSHLKLSKVVQANTQEEWRDFYGTCMEQGFEGIILRNRDGMYISSRSYDLQKVKKFQDAEFPIVGVTSGRGKMEGLAIFICETPEGKQFNAKMMGKLSDLAKYLEDESLWRGKLATIKFQNLTEDGLPRFPVCIRLKEEY